jgi:hypothetical protein
MRQPRPRKRLAVIARCSDVSANLLAFLGRCGVTSKIERTADGPTLTLDRSGAFASHERVTGEGSRWIARLLLGAMATAIGISCGGSSTSGNADGGAGRGGVSTGGSASSFGIGGTSAVGNGGTADVPTGIAASYRCDLGIENDPAVLFKEDFEEASILALLDRYSDHNGEDSSMALVGDIPVTGCGKTAGRFTASPSADTSSVFRQLAGIDEIYLRAYVKYQAGVNWHHTGISIKGYNPPSPWPLGLAGLKPNGDDDFSLALEPVYGVGSKNPRFDVYAYWMRMHSWMDQPEGDQAYYGNSLVHQRGFTADDDTWICVEVHLKLNSDLGSSAGTMLELWKNDVPIAHFDDQTPLGCWIKDKFCPVSAGAAECADYPSLCQEPYVPAELQWRSTGALQITGIGFGNYITEGTSGSVEYDHVVVATTHIGCVQSR